MTTADGPTLTIARLSRVLENHGTSELSMPQYRVLGLLSSGHERATELASKLAVTKPTLTSLIDGLVERGYVERAGADGDRRAVRLVITPAGLDAVAGRRASPCARSSTTCSSAAPIPTACSSPSTTCASPSTPAGPSAPRRPWRRGARHVTVDDRRASRQRVRAELADAAHTRPAPAGPGVGWLRRLGPFVRRYRGLVIATLVCSVVAQVLIGLLPLIQQQILDHSITTDERPLGPMLLLLLATGVCGFTTNYARRYLGAKVSVYLQHDMRRAIHRHLYELDFSRHDQLSIGDVMSRAAGDLTLIQAFFFSVPMLVANMTLLAVALIVMFVLSPVLSIVVVVFVPVFTFVAIRFRDRVFPATWNDQRLAGAVAGVVDEAVNGVRVVKAFAQEQREFDRLTDRAHELYQSRMRTARYNSRYSSTLQVLPMLAQLGVLAFGGWLALRGHLTLGVFLAFASYLVQIVTPVRLVASLMATTQQARAGAERVFELLDMEPRVADAPDAVPVTAARGEIELDHVGFGHRGGPPTLHEISLTIRPGERIGLVGASGSGKSTLAYLMARFYDPTSGTVRLDGVDVRRFRLDSLRSTVNVTFEESFLFSTTIRENIAFARPGATDAEIEAAARRRPRPRLHHRHARRLRHRRRRARLHPVRRAAPAHRPRSRRPRPAPRADPRRRHVGHRRPHRGGHLRVARGAPRGLHDRAHRPPVVHAAARRPRPRDRPWPHRRRGHERRAVAHVRALPRAADRPGARPGGHRGGRRRDRLGRLAGARRRPRRSLAPRRDVVDRPRRGCRRRGDGRRPDGRPRRPRRGDARAAGARRRPAAAARRPGDRPRRGDGRRRSLHVAPPGPALPLADAGDRRARARRRRHVARRPAAHPPRHRRRRGARRRARSWRWSAWRSWSCSSSAGATRSSSCCTPRTRRSGCSTRCAPARSPTSNGCRSTTTTRRWAGGS